MKKVYPHMQTLFGAYFHQDFGLDYDNPYEALREIVRDNVNAEEMKGLIEEMRCIIEHENEVGFKFFWDLDIGFAPFETTKQNKEFFSDFIREYEIALKTL